MNTRSQSARLQAEAPEPEPVQEPAPEAPIQVPDGFILVREADLNNLRVEFDNHLRGVEMQGRMHAMEIHRLQNLVDFLTAELERMVQEQERDGQGENGQNGDDLAAEDEEEQEEEQEQEEQ